MEKLIIDYGYIIMVYFVTPGGIAHWWMREHGNFGIK